MFIKRLFFKIPPRIRKACYRFLMYGSFLTFGEIFFYTLTKTGRLIPFIGEIVFSYQWAVDDRLHLDAIWCAPISTLYGQASLWMVPVYGSICLFGIEPVYRLTHDAPRPLCWLPVRAFIYMIIILVMECAWGWIYYVLLDMKIWYYRDNLAVLQFTSLAIAPMWFLLGIIAEVFVRIVNDLDDKLEDLKRRITSVP
ncbi:MAG TPA: hypothetical protein PKM65_03500 [Spirochaetota bacterium]|nr:hypothetical protein [Spirochaetota bacterium]HNT10850.1 hypothetical protein [Spirochaetota bacterium]HNV46812.1 hypothetical protein [Spirochaetota bacterium]HOS41617.1 hypothetical protein [Spirochaetota bacterium]HPI23918.1 hypothetical protein [Spirochaetota bacterium]